MVLLVLSFPINLRRVSFECLLDPSATGQVLVEFTTGSFPGVLVDHLGLFDDTELPPADLLSIMSV